MASSKKEQTPSSTNLFTDNYREFQKRRARFEDLDNDINESAVRLMKSMAAVAEKHPEEFFGLKPTERETFVLNKILDPAVVKAAAGTYRADGGDVIGGQDSNEDPGFFGGLIDKLLKKIDIADMIRNLIKDEKEYWFGQNQEEGERAEGEQTRTR